MRKEVDPMAETIKRRNEIDPRWQWRLTDIYPTQEAWEADFAQIKGAVSAFSQYRGQAARQPKEAIRAYFALSHRLSKLCIYAFLIHDTDNGEPAFQALYDRANTLAVQAGAAGSFLEPELLSLPQDALLSLADDPDMADYSVFLHNLIRNKPHTLSAQEEQILAMTQEMAEAPDNTFNMLTCVDMRFPQIHNAQGEEVPLTEATYPAFIRSENRAVRREAFQALFSTYASFGNTITSTYAAHVKQDLFYTRLRRFPSSVEASLFRDEIPLSVYDNLIAAMHDSFPALDAYLRLYKRAMKLEEVHLYDLYCSMVEDFHMALPYEEAFQLVLEGLKPLGEDYLQVLKTAYADGWIDVYPNQNKPSGAYSAGDLYDVHPYVLLNHNDNLDGAMTLAHELGHSMHSYYSNHAQPQPKADYSLFVAEVASTCNEMILMHHLLAKHQHDPKAMAYLYNHLLEQFRTTVFRQTMFAEFERIAHGMAQREEPLTREALSKAYYQLNESYYGRECVVDELIANEWMRIPHFYRSFYVYKYATGFSAAVYLAQRIVTEGEPAVRDYRRFLSAGCSLPPIEALKLAGVDMSSPEPVKAALKVFEDTVGKLDKLL